MNLCSELWGDGNREPTTTRSDTAEFCREVRLGKNDRNHHEGASLIRVIEKAGVIDQLNIGVSAELEVLFSRLASLCNAIRKGAGKAN